MTKISQYAEISVPTLDDLLIGTDVTAQNETKNFSIQSIVDLVSNSTPNYKVFTALLTQSGGDDPTTIGSGDLIVGRTYKIVDIGYPSGDWTNVGALNNINDTYFIATGTTPNSWGDGGLLGYNTGAPVATVLENTIGNVWFTYINVGGYVIKSNGLFIDNKTTVLMPNGYQNSPYYNIGVQYEELNTGRITTSEFTEPLIPADGVLAKTTIEIRVYN